MTKSKGALAYERSLKPSSREDEPGTTTYLL
jgi:hypothetical protein